MPKTKSINAALLRKVAKHVVKYPENYDQDEVLNTEAFTCPVHRNANSACGTQACIGGWAYFLGTSESTKKRDRNNGVDILDKASTLLNLTYDQRQVLFSGIDGRWPDEFNEAYRRANTAKARAKVAEKLINKFIKVKGDLEKLEA